MTRLDDVRAQPVALGILTRALADDRVASAYLFEGPGGVGKERAAIGLATAMIAGDDASVAARIASGKHPDVRVFRPREDGSHNLKVDFIRTEVLPFAQFAPFEAHAAFVIFPEADVSFPEQHPEAANALLKTLEEPKARVHFVLLAERPDRLLQTIRSRCQRVRFEPLPADVLDDVLVAHGVPDEARGPAIALARGRADRALALAADGRAETIFGLALEVHDAARAGKPGTMVEAAERLSKIDDRPLALEALSTLYRDLAILAAGLPEDRLAFRAHAAELKKRATDPYAAAEREAAVRATVDSLDRNANVQSALDALLFELRRSF